MDRLDGMDALLDRVHALEEEIAQLKSAAHPAIQRDMLGLTRDQRAALEACIDFSEGCLKEEIVAAARTGIASAPVATDKATCPKCGKEGESQSFLPGNQTAWCFRCEAGYRVRVLVISPPREEIRQRLETLKNG